MLELLETLGLRSSNPKVLTFAGTGAAGLAAGIQFEWISRIWLG